MKFSLESSASAATILGTVVSVFALVQSRAWLVLTSLLFVCLSIAALMYARRDRQALDAASIAIEGHSIDSLNVANLRRRVNQTLVIQEADHTARIEGEDLTITWKYSGYCRVDRETAMEFSVDSGARTSFATMDCIAYDLGRDPGMTHKIKPLLIGTDGITKKLSVPFLEPLKAEQSFGLLLTCTLPGCMKAGFDCYTSTMSFAQDRVRRCVVRLIFVGQGPKWVRVYESTPGKVTLLKDLAPSHRDKEQCEYLDVVEDRPGQSARVYAFWRDSA
jgi:hypothetical protein